MSKKRQTNLTLFLETTTKDFTKTWSLFSSKHQIALKGFSEINFPFKNNLSIDSSSAQLLKDGVTSYEELLRFQNNQDANL